MTKYWGIREIARVMGFSPSRVHRRADKESWPCEERESAGGPRRYSLNSLPKDVQALLTAHVAAQHPATDMTVRDFTVTQVAAILGVSKEVLKDRIRNEKWKGKNGDGVRMFPYSALPKDVQSAILSLHGMTPADIRRRVLRLKRIAAELNREIATIEGLVGAIR